MKYYYRLIIFTFIVVSNYYNSQNYKIDYEMNYKVDSLSNDKIHKDMILLVNGENTKFFSAAQMRNDSLNIENDTKGAKNNVRYDYDFMVIQDYNNQQITKLKLLNRDLYKVTDTKVQLNWKIENDTKKIGNYLCQRATLKYCDRHWEAWFTKEISLNKGPYFFDGLPGLIIYLKDAKDDYEFIFSGLQKSLIDINYMALEPLSINKKQMEEVQKNYYSDPYREMKSGKMLVIYQDEKGNKIKPNFKELTENEQLRIRKNNNPIELCEIIKYSK